MVFNVEGFTPYTKQSEWITQIESPSVKYITLCTGRQVGKTLLSQNLLLKWGLENNNQTIMFVSPVYSQARKVFSDIEKALAGTPLISASNKSNYEMSFINGTKIIFRSAENGDSLRGYTLDYLICDEAAYIKDDVWNTILKPTILVRGKKVLFISTPKGKNWFYVLHTRGQDEEQPEYTTIQASSYENPYISKDELDEARRTLPEEIFRQEILGEFIDTGGEVFNKIDRYCVISSYVSKQPNTKYFAGVDFGRQNDYTALTIFDENGNVVYMWRDRQQEWSKLINHISNKLREYEAQTLVEVNSIGDVLYEQLKQKHSKVEPFITTNSSKQEIVENIIYATNEGQVKLPTEQLEPALYRELRGFTYEYSLKTRKIQYRAMEGQHDDMIMSLCIAYHSLKQRKTKGVYHIY